MDHRTFCGVNLGINVIGLIFKVIILVVYFWGDAELWRPILLLEVVLTSNAKHHFISRMQ
ncbi:MAG: hypothetical protein A2W85_15290 [Bacteroidetes bacterium GWF2_41_31]|nr:MAG: hypothetical protein A2W85_15290 [Bacteroidetes bacterium GWF2_41_31]